MKSFSCDEVDISHSKLVELRQAGKLNLGIGQEDAAKVANDPRYAPKTTANAAFKFYNFVITAGFFYAVYLSFTDAWWWIIVGLFGCMAVFRANRKGHTQNYLDAAFLDEEFYQKLIPHNVWLYEMSEEDAAPFYRK